MKIESKYGSSLAQAAKKKLKTHQTTFAKLKVDADAEVTAGGILNFTFYTFLNDQNNISCGLTQQGLRPKRFRIATCMWRFELEPGR
jgi:hypothetical protein